MFYKTLLCAGLLTAGLNLPAFAANQHPISIPYLCAGDSGGSAADQGFFSRFVNMSGGLYWTGGSNNTDDAEDFGYAGVATVVPNYPAQTVSFQYQLGALSPGPQDDREPAIVVIYFTDGSSTDTEFGSGAPIGRGFSITSGAHGFKTMNWNAAAGGAIGKHISAVWFGDGGGYLHFGQSFVDYVTRVTVDGIIAEPQVHDSAAHTCLPESDP